MRYINCQIIIIIIILKIVITIIANTFFDSGLNYAEHIITIQQPLAMRNVGPMVAPVVQWVCQVFVLVHNVAKKGLELSPDYGAIAIMCRTSAPVEMVTTRLDPVSNCLEATQSCNFGEDLWYCWLRNNFLYLIYNVFLYNQFQCLKIYCNKKHLNNGHIF